MELGYLIARLGGARRAVDIAPAKYGQGQIDDAAYQARVDAVIDGLRYLVAGGTSVSDEVKLLASTAEEGGVGYDNVEFQTAMGKMGAACDEAGSLIAVSALPGQGG
ncbi:hypothetical protein ACWKWP_11620 [Agromyces soli]